MGRRSILQYKVFCECWPPTQFHCSSYILVRKKSNKPRSRGVCHQLCRAPLREHSHPYPIISPYFVNPEQSRRVNLETKERIDFGSRLWPHVSVAGIARAYYYPLLYLESAYCSFG